MPEFIDKAQDLAYTIVSRLFGITDGVLARLEALARGPRTEIVAATSAEHKIAASYLEKGRRSYNKKNYERAEVLFLKALDRDPNYIQARYFYGLVLYKQQHTEEAIAQWHSVIDLDPSSDFAAKSQRKIEKIKGNIGRVVTELESHLKE